MEEYTPIDEKIKRAIEKIKALKEEREILKRRVSELEDILHSKAEELEKLRQEKSAVKEQLEELLGELETIEL